MKKISKFIIIILMIIVLGVATYFYINITDKTKTNSNQLLSKTEVYSIKEKNFYLFEDENDRNEEYRGIKLLEYDNSNNDYAEIYYILYDYTTDPSFYYTLEITDEADNSLLIDEEKEQQIIGGIVSTARIKKLSLEQKFNFSVFEKIEETNSISNSAQIQIDLKKDLEEKVKIDQSSNLKAGTLGDINFKYIDDEYVYFGTTSHAYSTELTGNNFSVPIKSQYGNYLISEEHIEFACEMNVNNLKLEDAFEKNALINQNVGQYGLSDLYGMDIYDEQGQFKETVVINFEEMIDLCNGKTVNINGKQYTKNSFDVYADVQILKDQDVEIGNGIKAIKYHFEENEEYTNYMFTYKNRIYYITVPNNERTKEIVNQFLVSLAEY